MPQHANVKQHNVKQLTEQLTCKVKSSEPLRRLMMMKMDMLRVRKDKTIPLAAPEGQAHQSKGQHSCAKLALERAGSMHMLD